MLLGFDANDEFCDVDDEVLDPLGVGLGRNGVVGVVGVSGGVWLGVEGPADVALPGVTTDDWLSERIDTAGMTCVITSPPSTSFFTSNAKSTICTNKQTNKQKLRTYHRSFIKCLQGRGIKFKSSRMVAFQRRGFKV